MGSRSVVAQWHWTRVPPITACRAIIFCIYTDCNMAPFRSPRKTWLSTLNQRVDWLFTQCSYYAIPIAVALLSIVTLAGFDSLYQTQGGSPLAFATTREADSSSPPTQIRQFLQNAPQTLLFDTRRAEQPFWILINIPASKQREDQSVDFPSRHAQRLICWDGGTMALLGRADRNQTTGRIQAVRAGFAIPLGVLAQPLTLLCQATYSGPAKIAAFLWSTHDLETASRSFHHSTGLLEGGLLTLAVFILMTAAINRESRYVLFAAWLIGNLRLGALSMGWDMQWLERAISPDWMPMIRKLTIATYYILTYTLFRQFFTNDLKRIGYAWLLHGLQRGGLLLLLFALMLPYRNFLPWMWGLVAFGVFVLIFFLTRILIITHSRIALWYSAALSTVLFATFSEVIAAAFNFKLLLSTFNSVTAALASSLMAAFAFAEQMRAERLERMRAQAELHRTYEVTPVGLFTLDIDGVFLRSNSALRTKLSIESDAHPPPRWEDYFEPGAWRKLQRIVALGAGAEAEICGLSIKGAEARWYLVKATQEDTRIEGSLQDITERVKATERLRFLANNDSLTGVLNRRGIEHALDTAIRQQNTEQPLALVYLDLDRFKLINDLYGHQTGDEVLKQVCRRVKNLLADSHYIGRIGGDEFIVILRDTTIAQATEISHHIVEEISTKPYQLQNRAFQVRGSVGLIEVTSDMLVKEAISAADRACRTAKKSGHSHIVIYERHAPAFQERAEELRLIEELGSTFSPAGLFLEMQPIMSLQTPLNSLNFEVLLRMLDSQQSLVPASKIIAAAEASGNIAELDKWVLTTTLEWLEKHVQHLPNTRFICINLSGASLNDETFIEDIFKILLRFESLVKYLCIEITESVALHDLDHTRRLIERLRRLGAKIALDDFGAGYTSFSYLKELSADALKIDGSFIQSINHHPANIAIVEAIVELARNLGMRSIAEWAEDYATIETLAELGVDYVQGFIVAMPQAPENILAASSAASFITDTQLLAFIQRASDTHSELDWDSFGPPPVSYH